MHVHGSSTHGSNRSPAQQARLLSVVDPSLNFGQIVSQIAREIYQPASQAAPPVSTADPGSNATSTMDGSSGGGNASQSTTSPGSGQGSSTSTSPSTNTTSAIDVHV